MTDAVAVTFWQKHKRRIYKLARTYALIIVGTALVALGITLFITPNKLAAGGISGLSSVIYNITHILPVGTLVLIINVPLFILGTIFCGRSFGLNTIISTFLLSGWLNLFQWVLGDVRFVAGDYVLSALFGGVIIGAGSGIVFLAGTSTGGTDIIAKLVQLIFRSASIGSILLLVDACIIAFAMIVFRNVQIGLYSVISLFIQTRVMDAILEGVSFAKMVMIVSSRPHEIANEIFKLPRGVTGIKGEGMYTGSDRTILMCTVRSQQLPVIKDIVRSIDKDAFIIISDVREALGEGFTDKLA